MAAKKRSTPDFSTLVDLYRGAERRNRETEQLYTAAVVKRIAATLPKFVSDEAEANFPKGIRDWAVGYNGLRHITDEAHRPAFESARAARLELRSAAMVLLQTLDRIAPHDHVRLALQMGGKEPSPFAVPSDYDESCLRLVIDGVRLLAEADPGDGTRRRGRRKHSARHTAVLALAAIYSEATGKPPTLSRDVYNERHYGPFRNFCVAALTPIEGQKRVQVGIDALITRILYIRK